MTGDEIPARRASEAPGPAPWVSSPRSGAVRTWVARWWEGHGGGTGSLLRILTLPMEWGFRWGSGLRNVLYDRGVLPLQRAPVPVISVGNLTVGGSGKTPFAAWLLRELKTRGQSPALVAHGYAEDELVLHRRWNPDCIVLAQQDRAYGAWKAARKGASVVVLDDGFQHRRLARELDIVLVPATTRPRVRLLPRGPFREPLSAVARAGVVVVTKKSGSGASPELERRLERFLQTPPVVVAFVPERWTDVAGEPAPAPEGEYMAVCGIGDPEGFSQTLREATGRTGEVLAFPDHHAYSWGDVLEIRNRLGKRALVTTEKDAVRLEPYRTKLSDLRVLHLGIDVLEGEERLWERVERILREGRGAS